MFEAAVGASANAILMVKTKSASVAVLDERKATADGMAKERVSLKKMGEKLEKASKYCSNRTLRWATERTHAEQAGVNSRAMKAVDPEDH